MAGPDADLVVVGGGPVGLVAALHAARAGLRTVVVEPRETPVDKACGEGIMPAGVAELAALGVRPEGCALQGISYHDPGGRAVRASLGPRPGLGVRRTTLHVSLDAAARERGVAVVADRVVGVEQDDRGVTVRLAGGGSRRAGHVVAADGLHSPVRRLLGLELPARGPRRHGLRQHVRVRPWSADVEVHWGAVAEAYVTPVATDLVGVAVLGPGGQGYAQRLAEFPLLAARLAGAEAVDGVRGAGPLRQRVAAPVAGRVLLVGDAAGYVDALTGEGLTLGWRQARAAVSAVVADDPQAYAADHRRIGRAARLLTAGLVGATRHAPVRGHLVQAAEVAPWVYRAAVRTLAAG
ncbi:NAD(P)/FAD-dependent oxidoreductase [Arsenicicoccus dermatophilus]|uniref:NAD(P)/FAD-dependent oxidoreductase n=1 Tax=Arsenicicoccus dermatophilus TaxID=1076331 RepID=UPI0039176491